MSLPLTHSLLKTLPKPKPSVKTIEASLLEATRKFLTPLGMEGYSDTTHAFPWIDFSEPAEPKAAPAVAAQPARSSAAEVIAFDEETGEQLNRQVQFAPAAQETKECIKLPWREWWAQSKSLGAMAADKDSAVAVLHALHEAYDLTSQAVDIWYENKAHVVVATATKKAGEILLPPCVPKAGKGVRNNRTPVRSERASESDARTGRSISLEGRRANAGERLFFVA